MTRSVDLVWSNTSKNLTSQRILSGTDQTKLSLLKEIDADATTFTDTTVDQSAATTVYYQIVSVGTQNGQEVTAVSSVISISLPAVTTVNAPSSVTAKEVDS